MALVRYIHLGGKIKGQRLGQAIVNVARSAGVLDEDLHGWLFYIENGNLEKLLIDFLDGLDEVDK
jgi:hypothetical protein